VIDSHFGGVLNLVSLLNRERLRSFINLGSSDEYGNIPAPQKENDHEVPISPYSVGKLAAARFLQMLFQTEKFPSTTLRLFLVYGPRQESKRFLPHVIKGCLLNNVIPVSEGMQIRDFLFVKDLVEAVFKVFTNEAAKGEIINIASGKPVTIREVISKIQFKIQQGEPFFGKIPYRPGENMNLHASVYKAKRILNWIPATSLDTGLDITISYYREFERTS
jgi:nucleoside-diphosphate-sugar epimerase